MEFAKYSTKNNVPGRNVRLQQFTIVVLTNPGLFCAGRDCLAVLAGAKRRCPRLELELFPRRDISRMQLSRRGQREAGSNPLADFRYGHGVGLPNATRAPQVAVAAALAAAVAVWFCCAASAVFAASAVCCKLGVAVGGAGVLVGAFTVMETGSTAPNAVPAPSVKRQEALYVPDLLGACKTTDNVVHLPGGILLPSLTAEPSPSLSPLANTTEYTYIQSQVPLFSTFQDCVKS